MRKLTNPTSMYLFSLCILFQGIGAKYSPMPDSKMTNVGALPLPRGHPVICASVEWSGLEGQGAGKCLCFSDAFQMNESCKE